MNPHQFARLSITDAARLFGMTTRALRFYEDKGLVEAQRDRLNARFYDAVARRQLEWISQLRAAGLGLADIQTVLTAEAENGRGAQLALIKLAARRGELQRQLARTDDVVEALQARSSANLPLVRKARGGEGLPLRSSRYDVSSDPFSSGVESPATPLRRRARRSPNA